MLDTNITLASEHARPEAKLSYLEDQKEVTAAFYPDQLGLFLWRLAAHIKEDFSGDQIHRLVRVADSLSLSEVREVPFRITFRGRRVAFNVKLYKYAAEGVAALALYVRTTPLLANVFEEELKIFFGPPTDASPQEAVS